MADDVFAVKREDDGYLVGVLGVEVPRNYGNTIDIHLKRAKDPASFLHSVELQLGVFQTSWSFKDHDSTKFKLFAEQLKEKVDD